MKKLYSSLVIALLSAAFMVSGPVSSAAAVGEIKTIAVTREVRTIEVTARRFSYSPDVIALSKGETVIIKLISEDVSHGFFLDGYDIMINVNPGETKSAMLNADTTGRFAFRCSVTCGEFHPYMVGYLVVEPNIRLYAYLGLAILLGGLSLAVVTVKKQSDGAKDELFGFIDLDWRFDVTRFLPIRKLFKSRLFPLIPIVVNLFVFTIILIAGFVGGYSSGNYNFGIMIVWILWWAMLMFILVPGLSRTWCMVCPFPMFSDWIQRGRLFGVRKGKLGGLNLRFPRRLRNMWIMNIAFLVTTFFSGFFTVKPLATFILLSTIILLALFMGLIFQKRSFCLYICPVSGFQGLYSQFAMSEIRRKDPEICKAHSLKTCFVGNEKGHGCPWLLTPFDFKKNTYCGMCLECFKTCPYDNMAFNLRPPGVDLLVDDKREKRGLDEAWKAFIMLGISVTFFLTMQGHWGALKDMARATTMKGYLTFIALHSSFSLLVIPAIFLVFALLSKILSGDREVSLKKVFTNFSYTLVPIGLGVWIAFSWGIILPNGSYILHVISDPFAWGWDLFGTADSQWTPIFTRELGYLQGATLILFYLFSLTYGFRLSRQTYSDLKQSKRGWIPIFCFLTLTTMAFIWIYLG